MESKEFKLIFASGYTVTISSNSNKIKELYLNNKDSIPDINDVNEIYTFCAYYYHKRFYSKFLKYIFYNIDKDNTYSMLLLAEYFIEFKQDEEAINYYKKAIDLGNDIAIHNLAQYYKNNKDIDKALEIYSIGLARNDQKSIMSLGLIKYEDEKYESALELFSSLNSDYYYILSQFNKGWCYIKLNNDVAAIRCWSEVGELGYEGAIKCLINHYNTNYNRERLIYWLSKDKSMKSELIIKIKEHLTSTEEIEASKDFLNVLSQLEENDFNDLPLYLRVLIRSLKVNLNDLKIHCEYRHKGTKFQDIQSEYLKKLAKREPIKNEVIEENKEDAINEK